MSVTYQTWSCPVEDLGLIDYAKAFDHQKQTAAAVIKGGMPRLILCEHPPVLTLGRATRPENVLCPQSEIEARGVQLVPIDRGGDITLHAPGQLVAYPILNLNDLGRDLRTYLEKLERVAIDLLRDFDILADSIEGRRGVWVGPDKIASIGIGVRQWVTYHGIGLNVNTDLDLFKMIRPCGLDVQMTSMARLLGRPVDMTLVKRTFVHHFCRHFDCRAV